MNYFHELMGYGKKFAPLAPVFYGVDGLLYALEYDVKGFATNAWNGVVSSAKGKFKDTFSRLMGFPTRDERIDKAAEKASQIARKTCRFISLILGA